MRRPVPAVRFTAPPRFWQDLFRAWEVAVTAPSVVAMRTAQMAAAGSRPGRRDRDELERMGTEKFSAFGQAWSAMAMEMWLYPLRVGAAMMSGTPGGAMTLPLPRTFGVALAPVRRRVRANARRLARAGNRR